jgi:Kef-type K+ transport system membrane component KefB/mannitol/fructose-specific phosphotransferase system IIA component (Ntr-type)
LRPRVSPWIKKNRRRVARIRTNFPISLEYGNPSGTGSMGPMRVGQVGPVGRVEQGLTGVLDDRSLQFKPRNRHPDRTGPKTLSESERNDCMETLTSQNIVVMFLSLGVLLLVARLLGELAQRMRQPAVLGELVAGVLLGPTVLGTLAPELSEYLFPLQGPNAIALDAIATLAIVLFLLVAGMEVDLSTVWKQGKIGCKVGVASIVIPFSIAFAGAMMVPEALGRHSEADPLIFALFLAIAVSISALPIIAKTLMDMDLYRSDLGMVVVSAAIFNDLVGWIVFAIILGFIGHHSGGGNEIVLTISLTLAFAAAMLTVGRWLIHKALPFVQAYTRWPGGELSFALILGLLGAAFTEWIGIHAIFGAFVAGVAVGDSSHLRERTRVVIDNFVSFLFAPVFFASIGLKVNFLTHFDFTLTAVITLVAFVCKFSGSAIGARWGGMPPREGWAVGFAMVSVGAMGIIVGMTALNAGIIGQPLFVALVVMAIVTSMASGPSMRMILRTKRKWSLQDVLSSKLFMRELKARTRREVIHEMTTAACALENLDASAVEATVWSREEALSTGIGNGLALPHGRIHGLRESVVAVGLSAKGIDFDAPDGKPANVIFLVLTPLDKPGAQLEITSEIARIFRDRQMSDSVLRTENFTDFLALMHTGL